MAELDRAERARRVDQVAHSAEMEGLQVTDAWRADAEAWVAGEITLNEFGRRTRERYGGG